jgi:hypothetical protein
MDDFGGFIHCVLPADQLIRRLAVKKKHLSARRLSLPAAG